MNYFTDSKKFILNSKCYNKDLGIILFKQNSITRKGHERQNLKFVVDIIGEWIG